MARRTRRTLTTLKPFLAILLVLICTIPGTARAHEVRPAYLELRQTEANTYDVLWKVPARGDSLRLGLYVNFPDDCEQLTDPVARFVKDAYVERWSIRHPDALIGSTISIVGLDSTMTDVLVRIERLDGTTQVERLLPANPSLTVSASPSIWQVAGTYFVLGVEHILLGYDHLLFVLALILLVAHWRRIIETITAFTVAHSLTLAAATLGLVNVPSAPVEAVIALSIVFVASEVLRRKSGERPLSVRRPWLIAFVFGLLHGLGFAGALHEIGLPQQAIPMSLLVFNLGVEAGQILFVIAVALSVAIAKRLRNSWPEALLRVPAYAIGSLAMFWVIERCAGF